MAKLIAARLFAILASLALVLGVSATASAQTTQRLDIDWDKSGQTSEAPGRYEFNVTVNNYRAVLKEAYLKVLNTGSTPIRTTKATLRVNGEDKLSRDVTGTMDPYYYTLEGGEAFAFSFTFPKNAVDLYEGDNVQFVVESPDGGELRVDPVAPGESDPLWIEGTVTPWKVIEPTEPTLKASRCGVPKTVVLPRQAYVSYTQTIEGNTATVVAKPDTFHGYVFADDAKEKTWEFDITPEDCDDSQPRFYVQSFGSIKIQNQGTSETSPFVTKVQVPEAAKFQRAVVKITSPEAINSIISKLEIDKMDPSVNIDRRLIKGKLGENYLEIEFFPTQNGQRVESASIPDDTLLTFTTNIAKLPGVVVDIEIYGESDVYSPNPTPINKDSSVPPGHARLVVQVGGDRYLSSNGVSKKNNTGVTMVEGRRPSVQKYTPQAGAKLQLFRPLNDQPFGDEEANTQFTANETGELVRREWATCVSDTDGQCIFDIPVTGDDASPYYWVAMTQASDGFDIQDSLRVGGSGDDKTVLGIDLKYAYPTPHLQEGMTYYSGKNYSSAADGPDGSDKANSTYESLVGQLTKDGTASFMYEQNASPRLWHNRSSLGVMQQVRQNPPMPNRCGLRVGFLVDVSGSMRDPGIKKTQGVLKHVVNELNGTGTQMGMVAFNRLASAQVQNQLNNPNAGESYEILEPTSNKGRLDSWITGLNVFAAKDGFFTPRTTNWEGALSRMAEYNDAHNTSKYDVVYMITDGNPTYLENYAITDARPKNSGGNSTEMRHVEAAIGMANTLKSQGTRVVPIGIPSAWPDKESGTGEQQLVVSAANLEALSGKNPDGTPTESLREWNYATYVDNELLARALANSINTCAITVERRFYPGTEENPPVPTVDNTRPTIKESVEWNFDAKLTPTSGQEHEASKAPVAYAGRDNLIAEFKLNGTSDYSKVEIREPEDKIPAGWVRMDAGANGERAQCFDANGSPVSVSSLNAEKTNDFSVGSSIETIPMKGGYHCIVYYRPLPAPDSFNLKLTKVDYEKQTDSLDGASFELKALGSDSVVDVQDCPTAAGSCFAWKGLQPGRYQLIETKTPVGGYSLLPKPVYFRVAIENGASRLYILANAEDTEGKDASTVNAFPIVSFDVNPSTTGEYQIALAVANTKIGDLPKTGGMGIWGFAAAGLLICGVAAAVAVRRK